MQEIAGATGNLAVDDALDITQVIVHARVHNAQLEPMLAAKHIHAAPATGKVNHLLPGDLTGRHAHALALDAVVAAQQQVARMIQGGRQGLLNQANLHRQFL